MMKSKILTSLCATSIAATFAVASVAPAISAPLTSSAWFNASPTVTLVSQRGYRDDGPNYRGYRGSYEYRHGYKRHNGFWFPLAAFGLGAIIGGAVANNNNGGGVHAEWCYDHYRSYRAYDNTYQPYNGPRRLCYSPYS